MGGIVGNLGLGFGPTSISGDYPDIGYVREGIVYNFGSLVGTDKLPNIQNVTRGVKFGSGGNEFIGTYAAILPRIVPSISPNNSSTPSTSRVASQGIKPIDVFGVDPVTMFNGFQQLLMRATYLREEEVVLWFGDRRPALGMTDYLVWFSPAPDSLDPSTGPGRYGNKFNVNINVHLLSRNFQDPSQFDINKLIMHEVYRWRLINSIQNENLFSQYTTPYLADSNWIMPEPTPDGIQLTVSTMLISDISIDRTQGEEGTIDSSFKVTIPAVLSLTLGQSLLD